MKIERNPVPGSTFTPPIQCVDLDGAGRRIGNRCKDQQSAHPKGSRFKCPNRQAGNGKCDGRSFLYPRRWANTKAGEDPYFHYHQGIDLFAGQGTNIISVSDGEVVYVQQWDKKSSGYGTAIAVYSADLDMTFWYAHCDKLLVKEGQDVFEKTPIATVGSSGNAGSPHLHFEVRRGKFRRIGGSAEERELGEPPGSKVRRDPLLVLAELGPWGSKKLHDPRGLQIDELVAGRLHTEVEASPSGGFFPLGANNLWHGGVHLSMPGSATVHSAFDGEIVALRLDPDPTSAERTFGSTNFIVVRHELSALVFENLSGTPLADSEDDPRRVLYALYMHLGSAKPDLSAAKDFKWLKTAKLPAEEKPASKPSDAEERKKAEARAADEKEGQRPLDGAVGNKSSNPDAPGLADDIAWVQRRLRRHTGYSFQEPDELGVFDERLEEAIKQFQQDHVGYFRTRTPDGIVDPGGGTYAALASPVGATTPGSPGPTLDPDFVEKVQERGADGMTGVVSGLSIRVKSGDALWVSGRAAAPGADGGPQLVDKIHWEIFAESQIVEDWEAAELDDNNDDVSLDVPERIIDLVEETAGVAARKDQLLTAAELREFYSSPAAEFLRQTPCRFRSEWALDLDQAIARIGDMGIDTGGLKEELAPYVWWDAASDVLPASPKVWHYNPIEFCWKYQQTINHLKWAAGPKDPSLFGDLVVEVQNAHGGRQPGVVVVLLPEEGPVEASGKTSKRERSGAGGGEALFRHLPHLRYQVLLQDVDVDPTTVDIARGSTTRHIVQTDLEGPAPPSGELRVIIRDHNGMRAKGKDVLIALSTDAAGVVTSRRSGGAGEVVFEDLPFDTYTIAVDDAAGVAKTVNSTKRKSATVKLQAPFGQLRVELREGDGLADGVEVRAEQGGAVVDSQYSDRSGVARLELREGRYKLRAGSRSKGARVVGGSETVVRLELAPTEDRDPEGRLIVEVLTAGIPVEDELVVVLDESGSVAGSSRTEDDGLALLELEPGTYTVAADDASARAVVSDGVNTAVTLRI